MLNYSEYYRNKKAYSLIDNLEQYPPVPPVSPIGTYRPQAQPDPEISTNFLPVGVQQNTRFSAWILGEKLKIVKSRSQCLNCWAWVFMIFGAFCSILNAIRILRIDKKSQIGYINANGDYNVFQKSKQKMLVFHIIDVIQSVIILIMGIATHMMVKPAIHSDQAPNERRSKKTLAIMGIFKRIVQLQIIIYAAKVIYGPDKWSIRDVNKFIDQYYSEMDSSNFTVPPNISEGFNTPQEATITLALSSHSIDPNVQKRLDNLKFASKDYASDIVKFHIDFILVVFGIFEVVFSLIIFHYFYSSLWKLALNQKGLEEVCMGPENAGSIQYIAEPVTYPQKANQDRL